MDWSKHRYDLSGLHPNWQERFYTDFGRSSEDWTLEDRKTKYGRILLCWYGDTRDPNWASFAENGRPAWRERYPNDKIPPALPALFMNDPVFDLEDLELAQIIMEELK